MNLCHDLAWNLDLNHMHVNFVRFVTTFFICVNNIWALEVIYLESSHFRQNTLCQRSAVGNSWIYSVQLIKIQVWPSSTPHLVFQVVTCQASKCGAFKELVVGLSRIRARSAVAELWADRKMMVIKFCSHVVHLLDANRNYYAELKIFLHCPQGWVISIQGSVRLDHTEN